MVNGREPSGVTGQALEKLRLYQQMDNERDTLMQAMIQKIDSDAKRLVDLQLDLDDQKASRAHYQSRSMDLEAEIQRLSSKLNSGSFVVVLIDGDGAKFRDEFLRDPEQGAVKAAWKLKEAVKGATYGLDIPILVRVYANVNDLAKSLRLSGVIDYDESMRTFAEQFTNTHADCDFINVVQNKEAQADAYIQGFLIIITKTRNARRYLLLVAMTMAIFMIFVNTQAVSLEFPILRFDGVFRSEPLNNETKRGAQVFPFRNRSPPQLTPGPIGGPIGRAIQASYFPSEPISPEPQEQREPTPSTSSIAVSPVQAVQTTNILDTIGSDRLQPASSPPDKSPAQSQVFARTPNVISSGNGGTSISYATAGGTTDHQNVTVKLAKPKKQVKYAYYNEDKFRIDTPTQHPPRTPAQVSYQNKFQAIKPAVFCNDHYLKGKCKRGVNCDKEHGVELTPAEVAIHRYKARTSLCPQGPLCTDYDCYLSHHCPRLNCTRSEGCPFYHTANWGDLHYTKEQLQPKTKWAEGDDFPEYL
ncbi:hypothetical protein GQX73_g7143 [Xylaria multiplex]|uniref:C3H1-type domain-containing protein n=1 Tax=Xylaria multiplex TaxID=323545 RepID=A0A7C8IU05_9PEZI|nr:hypothetical protein GQX73_g7143 [Xylaria multiplex]